MSNEAGRILLAILHGESVPAFQRRNRTPSMSGFMGGGGSSFPLGIPRRGAPGGGTPHHPHYHAPMPDGHLQSHLHQLPSLPLPLQQQGVIPMQIPPYFHVDNSPPISHCNPGATQVAPSRRKKEASKPIRSYSREVILSFADSDLSRRLPRRLELAFERFPDLRRKAHGETSSCNPYYYDPAATYSLGLTQLWDSQLQQWVVMGGHKG